MSEICQTQFPEPLRSERALPGTRPLGARDWITVDECYAAQMAYRDHLLQTRKDRVLSICPGSEGAQAEALAVIVDELRGRAAFEVTPQSVRCPDGRQVDLRGPPLEAINGLIQEDICLLEKPLGAEEHVLTAGLLCFPASWTLGEKIGRPLTALHGPVAEYDAGMAKRVQRLFDGIRAGAPLWRFNRLWYAEAELFQPRPEASQRAPVTPQSYSYLRMEKQSLLRLPETQAVLFSIHTYVLHKRDVPAGIDARAME